MQVIEQSSAGGCNDASAYTVFGESGWKQWFVPAGAERGSKHQV
jgi:hypothetical protein